MNIWVVRNTCLYSNETYLSTHITEKGALITAIKVVRDDLTSGYDEDELEDNRPDMPHHHEEDLMQYGSDQLRRIIDDWWEYSYDLSTETQYQIHQTQVTA
tara:strand:- start:1105 stop:1407 length:303 start_codon:yes stop_codon:yes gene_type:complete